MAVYRPFKLPFVPPSPHTFINTPLTVFFGKAVVIATFRLERLLSIYSMTPSKHPQS